MVGDRGAQSLSALLDYRDHVGDPEVGPLPRPQQQRHRLRDRKPESSELVDVGLVS